MEGPLPEVREPNRLYAAEHGDRLLLDLAVDAPVLNQDDLEPVGHDLFVMAYPPTAARL